MRRTQNWRPKCGELNALSSGSANATLAGARLDEAIALLQEAFPGRGLKLVVPPPLADGSAVRLSLSAWRRGEESVRVHSAATAREAVSHLLASERVADHHRCVRQHCLSCHGVGWYIASDGNRTLCTH